MKPDAMRLLPRIRPQEDAQFIDKNEKYYMGFPIHQLKVRSIKPNDFVAEFFVGGRNRVLGIGNDSNLDKWRNKLQLFTIPKD